MHSGIKWSGLIVMLYIGLTVSVQGKDCTSEGCHGQLVQYRVVHSPVEGDCTICHIQTGDHAFQAIEGGARDMCYQCHDDRESGSSVHAALMMEDCLYCHNPHGGDNRALTRSKQVSGICFDCHDEGEHKGDYIHGPNAAGNCSICHDSHSSDHAGLLIASADRLCVNCHMDKDYSGDGSHMHTPLADGCTGCHNPHASAHVYQLISEPGSLCSMCHEDIVEKAEQAVHPHAPVQKENGCVSCHDAHGSPFENNLRREPLALCLNCHDKPIIGTDGKDHNIAEILRQNPNKHGPVADGNCSGCHDPHGSDVYKLLLADYPEAFYIPYREKAYDLCFLCHESDLVKNAVTSVQTGFRNGDQNLHYLHVNREKGRTCRACHMAHASSLPRHIREETPFGRWDIPIQFEQTKTGGTCSPGCHKAYRYDRINPESYR